MPQAPRKDAQAQRLQDKEAKRARGALSCAECRRLKLKCDKTVPCSSCKRRGCAAICPNGSLITGQGTRFVLADTERLHQKIAQMSDRIRQLEDALAIAQSALVGPSGETHPLLDRDLIKIKSSLELHSASTIGPDGTPIAISTSGSGDGSISATPGEGEEEDEDEEKYIDAFGTLAIRDDGAATFYGRSAGQESLLIGEVAASSPTSEAGPSSTHYYIGSSSSSTIVIDHYSETGHTSQTFNQAQYYAAASEVPLPKNIANTAHGFPLVPTLPAASPPLPNPNAPVTLSLLLHYYLPPFAEGMRLIRLYLEQAPWFFGAASEKQVEEEIIPMWYGDEAPGVTTLPGVSSNKQKQRDGTTHDLALLFMILCFGALTDTSLPPPPDNPSSDRFYQLTKVALTLDPNAPPDVKSTKNGILDRPPSVATVQTMSLMGIYEGLCSGENSIETTWALMGLAAKLSQSIGLHRDSARWKLTPSEVQKRRAFFWELFITDCWQSLATGRLATFSLPFVDCELPFDPDRTIAADGSTQPSFPFWKARFGAECVSAVVQGTLTSRAPKYSIILDLDRKVRDMELPQYASGEAPQGKGLAETMSHFMPQNYRELTLLYIHRCFFAHALSSSPLDPVKSQYAPSFLAGYRSACTILAAVKQQFTLFPAQIARFWVLWTHAFSASVMLASVATHATRSKMAPAALLELKIACDLFEEASRYGGRAGKFLPILKRLQGKAQQAYRDANNGLPPDIPNDIFKPSVTDDQKDELSIFSGKTHTLSTKSTPVPPSSSRSSRASNSSRSQSDSPQIAFADNPSFANVHESLIVELNTFQPLIREQVQNAYRIGQDVFGGGPMVIDPIRKITAGRPTAPLQAELSQDSSALVSSHKIERDQAHQQALLQSQYHHHQQLEHERVEREKLELQTLEHERVERERQELEQHQRLQKLELQRQQEQRQQEMRQQLIEQQEAVRQQQAKEQHDLRQQQERAHQQQKQNLYRQQLEQQRQQLEQEAQIAQYHQHQPPPAPQPVYANSSTVSAAMPARMAPPQMRHLSHSQSHPALRQAHLVPEPQEVFQSMPHASSSTHPSTQARITPQHTGMSSNQITPQHTGSGPPQHSMYAIPPSEYAVHQHPSPDEMDSTPSYTPPTSSYGHPAHQIYPVATPGASAFMPATYRQQWNVPRNSFAMPIDVPQPLPGSANGFSHQTNGLHQPQPQYQHYTPAGALRGIAADDNSLQETWQSYMNKVGSPRQFFED